MKCQIYGERCSGTNYLEQVVAKNFPSVEITWDYGWKHFFPKDGVEQATDHLFIVLYRNPFDWIKSFHKHPWHTAPELREITTSEFIRKEWKCVWDEDADKTPDDPIYGTEMLFERDPLTNRRFTNVLKMRSAKILHWQKLEDMVTNFYHIQYEQLLSNPEGFIRRLAARFPIRPSDPFHNVESYKGMGGEKYRPSTYGPLSQRDISFIVEELEERTESSVGYNLQELAAMQLRQKG